MSGRHVSPVVRLLRDLAPGWRGASLSDRALLERFLTQRDEAAFAVLVERYGRLVHGVCRRVLRHEQDAEDAFQATFLVLVRRAAAIRKREAVGSWLYGVAYRVASKVRAGTARRRARQTDLVDLPAPEAPVPESDLQDVLDEELNRLPARFRLPVVLCYLDGKTAEEAARQLGCARGTILSRLARARARLRPRLIQRGLALSGGLAAALASPGVSAAPPPALWARQTIEAALRFATNKSLAETASVRAAALAEGVLRTMHLARIKLASIFLLTLTLTLAGVAGGVGLVPRATEAGAAAGGPAGAEAQTAVADQMLQKIRAEWQRVLEREQSGNPWMDKVTFDSAYEELKKQLQPTPEDLRALSEKLTATLKDNKGKRDYLWRAQQVLGHIQWDLGQKEKGLEHYKAALEQYPAKAYDDPAKHSSFQHVANQAAGRVWDLQGAEAAEKFILDLFGKAPQFQYFFEPWWEEQYRERQEPARYKPLLRKVVALYDAKAAKDKNNAGLYRTYRDRLKKDLDSRPETKELQAGGDPMKRYYLLRPGEAAAGAKPKLLLVLPGGHGQAREFLPFVTTLAEELAPGHVVALLSAPQWTAEQAQKIVWPKKTDRLKAARFTTEEFVAAVFNEIKQSGAADTEQAVLFGWSSSGPAVYATALSDQAPPSLRYYVLSAVFKPENLPPLTHAKGKRIYVQHGDKDQLIPLRWAKQAERALTQAKARVQLEVFEGGHGFAMSEVYPSIQRALEWLEAAE
jgi:RNA polymerase sigma factor (sigma-70 family)